MAEIKSRVEVKEARRQTTITRRRRKKKKKNKKMKREIRDQSSSQLLLQPNTLAAVKVDEREWKETHHTRLYGRCNGRKLE